MIVFGTKAQLLNVKNHKFSISLDGKNIPLVKEARYLGIILTSDLSWDKQILEQCRGINFKVHQLKQLSKTGCSQSLLLQTYNTFVQPKIDYAISIWGCTTQKNINKVQRIQNRAARIILNNFDKINFRGINLVKTLRLPNVIERRNYFLCKFTHESIHGLAPDYLTNMI